MADKKFNSDSLCAFKCILIHIFVYVSSSLTFDYAMYQTNQSQVQKICYNVVISEKNLNV
jgi:hypothetical protein